jgi:hypothetical protein
VAVLRFAIVSMGVSVGETMKMASSKSSARPEAPVELVRVVAVAMI